jgi:hypothetical protein
MKSFFQTIGLLIIQTVSEVLVMAVLAKLGISYMDFNAGGESIIELIMGIAYYYSLFKLLIIVLPYIVLMLIANQYLHKNLSLLNLIISSLFTIGFWLYFDNPIKEIVNPVMGTMMSGLFILFFRVNLSIKKLDSSTVF